MSVYQFDDTERQVIEEFLESGWNRHDFECQEITTHDFIQEPCERPGIALKYYRDYQYDGSGEDTCAWVCKYHTSQAKADEIVPLSLIHKLITEEES